MKNSSSNNNEYIINLFYEALSLQNKNEYNKAVEIYYKILDIKDDFAEVYNNLGIIYKEQGHLEKSFIFCTKALSINPLMVEPLYILSNIEYITGYDNILIIAVNYAIEKHTEINNIDKWLFLFKPESSYSHFAYANILKKIGKIEDAIKHYDLSIQKYEGAGWSFTNRSILLIKKHYKNFLIENKNYIKIKKTKENYNGVITMSDLGLLGRFGNQILQYMFLKLCALRNNLKVETPDWLGRYMFEACKDENISYCLKRLEISDFVKNGLKIESKKLINKDIRGFIEFPIIADKREKSFLISLFEPISFWKNKLDKGYNILQKMGNTIISFHLRRGDFINSKQWIPDIDLYILWLEKNWKKFKNPVLYIASDDVFNVKKIFHKYRPLTRRDIIEKIYGIDFFIDHYILKKSNIVIVSPESSFSLTASMLNISGSHFFIPEKNKNCIIQFDPWNYSINSD